MQVTDVFEWQQLLIFVVMKGTVNDKLSCMLLHGQDSCLVVVHKQAVQEGFLCKEEARVNQFLTC